MGRFPSGQRGQTVNLLQLASVVRIHLCPFFFLEDNTYRGMEQSGSSSYKNRPSLLHAFFSFLFRYSANAATLTAITAAT